MAYSVLATVVTGTPISSTTFGNVVKDNFDAAFPLGVDGWTSYTPTLTQSGAVTKTSTYAKYQRVGRLITVNVLLDITGSGSASNVVLIGVPVTGAAAGAMACGTGYIFDTSAGTTYSGVAQLITTTTIRIFPPSGTNPLGLGTFTAALASGDQVSLAVAYEAAS